MATVRSQFDIYDKKIGEGHFAVVRLGKAKGTGKKVAVKCIDKRPLKQNDIRNIKREAQILSTIKHKHVIRLYGYFDETRYFYIVTEFLEGGELFDRIIQKESYNESDAAIVVGIIADALAYCHKRGVVHRDIKPENLLLVSKDDDTSLKLADFGFAAEVIENNNGLSTPCGTPGYCAPEIITGKSYDSAVDIWSLGVVTFILLGGYPPFYDRDPRKLLHKIVSGKYEFDPSRWSDISSTAQNFIKSLLHVNPSRRPSAVDVLNHPWIKGSKKAPMLKRLTNAQIGIKEYQMERKLKLAMNTLSVLTKLEMAIQGT